MSYTPAQLTELQTALAPTRYCIDDMLDHGIGSWHVAVLLDIVDHLSSLDPQAVNDQDFAGHTPLDIAYRLNRTTFIERLEALGAQGDKKILESKGVGVFIENDRYVHLPAKQGKHNTLERRHIEGGSLNDRDSGGNTPIHWLAANGHAKAVALFSEKHFMFNIDLDAKNNEGNTARNMALLEGHQEIAQQLLIWELEDYIDSVRIRHMMRAGLKKMLPNRKLR